MNIEKERYNAIDGLKTIACLCIVAMHVISNTKYNINGFVFERFIPSLGYFVYLFMVISAFGMCCGYFEKFMSQKINIIDFYANRYKKILPFFALLCFIDLTLDLSIESVYEVFANLTLCFGLIPNVDIKVIGVGWFLGTVFAFYLLFPFFCFLLANKKRAWFAFCVSLVMNYLCRIYFNVGQKSIVYSFVFFMLGGMIYIYRKELLGIRNIKLISMVFIILSMAGLYVFDLSVGILLLFCFFTLVFAISDEKGVLDNKFTNKFSAISFEVYLCHMLVFRLLEKIHFLNLFSNDYINYFFVFIGVAIGAVLFSVTVKTLIKWINMIAPKSLQV